MNDTQRSPQDNGDFKIQGYPVTAYGWDGGSIEIYIAKDSGGWSGCGHPGSIEISNDDLTRMVNILDEAVTEHELRDVR